LMLIPEILQVAIAMSAESKLAQMIIKSVLKHLNSGANIDFVSTIGMKKYRVHATIIHTHYQSTSST